jgi:ClpP class serine protease
VSMNENASQKMQRKRAGNETASPQTEDQFAGGYDFLLINHDIDDALFPDVLECVTENRKNEKVVVIVVTYGGQANVAYRVGRFLQTMYEEVVAFIPSICKSAGHAYCCLCQLRDLHGIWRDRATRRAAVASG